MRHSAELVLLLLLLLLGLASCAGGDDRGRPSDHVYLEVETADDSPLGIRAEIADTPAERERGLMFRAGLADKEGMLFIFDQEQVVGFWMKNTTIPLDLIFIDAGWRVIQIERSAQPCTADPCEVYYSGDEVLYVLEVNAGTSDMYGIAPGTVLHPLW